VESKFSLGDHVSSLSSQESSPGKHSSRPVQLSVRLLESVVLEHLSVVNPCGHSSSPGNSVSLHESHGPNDISGNEFSTLFESESHSLDDSLDMSSSSDGSLNNLSASSSIESLGRGSLVEFRATTPAPTGAVGAQGTASGVLEFTTASAVLAHSKLAPLRKLALADNLLGFLAFLGLLGGLLALLGSFLAFLDNDLDLLLDDFLLGDFASSAVEELLGGLLVESRGTAPAPLGAELFHWASSFVLGTATSFLGNGVFTARVSRLHHSEQHGDAEDSEDDSGFVHLA